MDTHNRTVKAANQTRSTQLNLPITEVITITIATTTYPKKKRGKMEEYLTKDIVSTRDSCPRCIFFFWKLKWLRLIRDRISCHSVSNHTHDKQIRLPLHGCPILLVTHMITDRIGLHLVLLLL